MKKILYGLFTVGLVWFYGQSISVAEYYSTTQYKVEPDTTTNKTVWRYRGDQYIGTSSAPADAHVINRGTGTVEAIDVRATRLHGDGSDIQMSHSVLSSTGTKSHATLESNITQIGIDTGTLAGSTLSNSSATATYVQIRTSSSTAYNTWVASAIYTLNGGGGSTASGDSIKKSYTQTAHGFSAGMAVYWNGSTWIRSKADSVTTADALGVIDTVGVDTFSITMQGYISDLSGLTSGSVYYISATSSGTLTTTEPTTYGYVSKPMLFALGTSSGIVVNMRGVVVTQAGVYDGVPVGGFIWYSTTTAPSDFLYCNGSAVSRTTYSALFANIGTRYGSGDGSTTFNLPDGRGLFIRQLDDGKGIDPDGTFRVAGSTQTNAFQGHKHNAGQNATNGDVGTSVNYVYTGIDDRPTTTPITDGTNGTPRTASETRPSNMALCLMIKYRVNISTQGGILDQANTWTQPQTFSTVTYTMPRFKIGSFTRVFNTASGDVSYTGVGFVPKAIMFFGGIDGNSENWMGSFGFGMVGSGGSYGHDVRPSVDMTTNAIYHHGSGTDCASAVIKSMDADGFTLTWTFAGTASGATITFYYLAFR